MNQEKSEQNEVAGMKKGADSTGTVMHMRKSGWCYCNEEDTDGRPRVTVGLDEERVLYVE